jgi:hypothetical protein
MSWKEVLVWFGAAVLMGLVLALTEILKMQ